MYSISKIDLTKFACASKEIEALTDMWLKGMKDFIDYYKAIPEELLDKTIDNEGETAISVGKHVIGAAMGHVCWSLELAKLTAPEKSYYNVIKAMKTRDEIIKGAEELMETIPLFLAPMTNDHLSNQGVTSWGEHMSSEGMLEHTVMHIYRHMRQLKVRLWVND
jgi:hypothetical protein